MANAFTHWDGAGLERKVRSAGRPWTVGDMAMVADGQWGVGLTAERDRGDEALVEGRAADGRSVEMTVEELARAVGSRIGRAHREDERG